jgi:hypothetical protein
MGAGISLMFVDVAFTAVMEIGSPDSSQVWSTRITSHPLVIIVSRIKSLFTEMTFPDAGCLRNVLSLSVVHSIK